MVFMDKRRILLVDDEPKIAEVLRAYLEREGYQVLTAATGRQAIDRVVSGSPDLVILDLNLPDMDGLEVCRTVRKSSAVSVIMLTGRGDEVDKIIGLEIGADDYITKPFSAREVAARVKAVLRRQPLDIQHAAKIPAGNLLIDPARFEADCSGVRLDLTTTEFRLLAALARNPGVVLSRAQLLDAAQGIDFAGYERTIDVHIKNLRQKMPGDCGCQIETVRSVGYKLEVKRT
jgi:two-component system, OmpR family, response regulator AdeR